jgi:hypothetical protein
MTIIIVVVLLINILDRLVGVTEWFHSIMMTDMLYYFFWPLKTVLAASGYIGTLYVDIHRKQPLRKLLFSTQSQYSGSNNINNNNNNEQQQAHHRGRIMPCSIFLPKVGYAFCKVLPAYPFLAVGMSVGFLFLIHLWEMLHLPLDWLQKPIYYGTLYGPFAYTYLHVKRQVLCVEAYALPT